MEQEKWLKTYLKVIANMHFDCTPVEAHKLAYTYAITKNIKVLGNWKCKGNRDIGGIAVKDWYCGFMNHLKTLSERTAEGINLWQATASNSHSVGSFFGNLEWGLDKQMFRTQDIWNVNESGLKNIHEPGKIIAQWSQK